MKQQEQELYFIISAWEIAVQFSVWSTLVRTEANTFLGQVTDPTRPGSLSLMVAVKEAL